MANQNLVLMPGRSVRRLRHGAWTVDLEFSIRADVRRLFLALTVPEYVETWITPPGKHYPACSTTVRRTEEVFVVDHRCGEAPSVRVTGTYLTLERHQVSFSWRVEGAPCATESCADIRLKGNFESTWVRLRHSRLDSYQQYIWHRDLWSQSLAKLMRLYEAPRSSGSVVASRAEGRVTRSARNAWQLQ